MRLSSVLFFALALSSPALAANPIRVVAAENFYADVASQIGGSHVSVSAIMSNPDQDPHLFESSASTARDIADAQIVIYNGIDYDPWMDKLLAAAAVPERTVIVAADIAKRTSGDNPHIWYAPGTLLGLAAALADEFARRDPADAADYRANFATFSDAFAKALGGTREIKARFTGTEVTATEPVFGYMADFMGLTMLNLPFQLAIMNDTEPSPKDVAAFEQSLSSHTAKILFYNSQVTDDTTARLLDLAKANNVPVVGVTETMPAGETVETWFAAEIAAVRAALGTGP